jgi:hypothetical protein
MLNTENFTDCEHTANSEILSAIADFLISDIYAAPSDREDAFTQPFTAYQLIENIQTYLPRGNQSVLVFETFEWALWLKLQNNASVTLATNDYHDKIRQLCEMHGIKYACISTGNIDWRYMRFDVVCGNPPFQDKDAASSKKAWTEFVLAGMKLVKPSGHLAMITPNAWADSKTKVFKEVINKYSAEYICLNAREYFPTVGTTVSWFIVKKELPSREHLTTAVNGKDTVFINLNNITVMPETVDTISLSIMNKVFNDRTRENMEVLFDSNNDARRPHMSKVDDNVFHYPNVHGASIRYGSKPHPNQFKRKIVFPLYAARGTVSDKMVFDMDGEWGYTEHAAAILVDTPLEGTHIMEYLTSDIMAWLLDQTKTAGFTNRTLLAHIPKIDLAVDFSPNLIYNALKLTPEEIAYIEANAPGKAKKQRKAP